MSSTHTEAWGEVKVTVQHCEEPGCDKYLGVNYPSSFCDEHRPEMNIPLPPEEKPKEGWHY